MARGRTEGCAHGIYSAVQKPAVRGGSSRRESCRMACSGFHHFLSTLHFYFHSASRIGHSCAMGEKKNCIPWMRLMVETRVFVETLRSRSFPLFCCCADARWEATPNRNIHEQGHTTIPLCDSCLRSREMTSVLGRVFTGCLCTVV